MPMLLSWPINLSFPGWEWGLLFLKKLQFNLSHLPSLRPIQVLSSSHYVWSNPSLLGLQSRTPAPCGWDCSGSAGRRHLCNYTMIHCLLFVPRESFHGLERSAMEAELSTASRHACLYRTSTSFCNHKLPKCAENMNSFHVGPCQRACHEQHLWVMWWNTHCNPECCKSDERLCHNSLTTSIHPHSVNDTFSL